MNSIALPAFTDNCIWMFHDGREAVVVDPGDAAPMLAARTARRLSLAPILVTHQHDDHVDGVDVPGHTRDHTAYCHNGADQAPLFFCGDPLFSGGAARPTLPGTIACEPLINPYLRCAEPAVAQAAQQHGATSRDPVDVFAALRQWKNDFR